MAAVAEETRQAKDLIERVETLEGVANSLPEQDERRDTLLHVVEQDLTKARGLRLRIAAELLGLSERTVRQWVKKGRPHSI